jgi:hypothetical protein
VTDIGGPERLLAHLPVSSHAHKAYLYGVLWELSADQAAAEKVAAAGVVPVLLQLLSTEKAKNSKKKGVTCTAGQYLAQLLPATRSTARTACAG